MTSREDYRKNEINGICTVDIMVDLSIPHYFMLFKGRRELI